MQIKKTRNTEQNNRKTKRNLEIVPLKYLSNFRRNLDTSLINCEVSLTQSENSVLTDITTQAARTAQGDNLARPAIHAPTNVTLNKRHKIVCSSCYFVN